MKKVIVLFALIFSMCTLSAQLVYEKCSMDVVDSIQRCSDEDQFLNYLQVHEVHFIKGKWLYLLSYEPIIPKRGTKRNVYLYRRPLNIPGLWGDHPCDQNMIVSHDGPESYIKHDYHREFGSGGSYIERIKTSTNDIYYVLFLGVNDGTNTYKQIFLWYVVREYDNGAIDFSHHSYFMRDFNNEKYYFGFAGLDQETNTFKCRDNDKNEVTSILIDTRYVNQGKGMIKKRPAALVKFSNGDEISYNVK